MVEEWLPKPTSSPGFTGLARPSGGPTIGSTLVPWRVGDTLQKQSAPSARTLPAPPKPSSYPAEDLRVPLSGCPINAPGPPAEAEGFPDG